MRRELLAADAAREPGGRSELRDQADVDAILTMLYRVHALRLTRLAYVMLGDKPAAEDVVQDAFAGLYRLPVRAAAARRAVDRRLSRTNGFRRWATPMAAAVAVVAVISLASFLTAVVPGHGLVAQPTQTVGSRAARPAAPGYPANLESGLIGLFVPATGAQYATGALFSGEYRALEQSIVSECMATYGFRVQAASPPQIARGDWDLTQFPDVGAIQRTGTLPSYSLPAAPREPEAYTADLSRCQSSSSPFQAMVQAGTRLGAPWLSIVTQIQSSAPVLATLPELRACAARYGWPGQPYGAPDSTIGSFADFADWVTGHLDGAGGRGTPAAEMDALSRHWAVVFVQCARPTVTVIERLQLAAQQTFLRQHQPQFTALMAVARADFAAAERQSVPRR